MRTDYIKGWNDYATGLKDLSAASGDGGKLYYTSAMVLKAHEDKTFDGGMIASLTVPWGTSVTDDASGDERGILPGSGPDGYKDGPTGYHVVWPRDLYQVATAFIAAETLQRRRMPFVTCAPSSSLQVRERGTSAPGPSRKPVPFRRTPGCPASPTGRGCKWMKRRCRSSLPGGCGRRAGSIRHSITGRW